MEWNEEGFARRKRFSRGVAEERRRERKRDWIIWGKGRREMLNFEFCMGN
jgi:hypothetical protein